MGLFQADTAMEKTMSELEKLSNLEILANSFFSQGKFKEALELYEEMVRLNPADLHTQSKIATLYILTGNPQKAAALFEEILQKNPDHCDAQNNLATLYLSKGCFEEAISLFQKFLRQNPDQEEIRMNLALAHFLKGDLEEAKKEVDKILQKDLEHSRAKRLLREIQEKEEKREGALDEFVKTLARKNNSPFPSRFF